ncbi:MFS transporter [Candidatus Geothermarchaeota archaeon]|nr:MAG: MFS transporter [Candidatus Geothermarchaeota archaeon]
MTNKPKNLSTQRGSLKNIISLGLVSFFTDVSSEMCFSFLPNFIRNVLGGTRGVVGLIEGIAEATSYVLRTFSGVLSDKIGKRKILVFTGYVISNLAKPLFSVSRNWVDALLVRFIDRVGKGVRTSPRDALLSESIKMAEMGKAFGIHRTLDQLGAVIGPAMALVFIPLIGMRNVFLLSIIPGLIALIVLYAFVEERVAVKKERSQSIGIDFKKVLTKDFKILLLIVSVFSIGAFNYSFILLRAEELGVAIFLAPGVYIIIQLSHALMGMPAGMLSDRIGKEFTLVIGYLLLSVTSLLLMSGGFTAFYVLLLAVMFGLYQGITETVQRAMIPGYVPPELKGTAYGVYYLVVGSCFFISNSLIGFLWDSFGIRIAFAFSLLTSVLGAIGMTFLALRRRSTPL